VKSCCGFVVLCVVLLVSVLVGMEPSRAETYSKGFPGKGSKQAFENSKVNVRKAIELARDGKLAEAEAEYRKAIATYPHYAISHFDLARTLYLEKKLKDAETEYQAALKLEPKLYDAWYNLAILYEDSKKKTEAENSYRQAIAIKSDYFDAIFNLALLLKGNGKLEESKKLFESAGALNVSQKEKDDVAVQLKEIATKKK
jgi:Tfp pilus assembly protein PilF